MKLPCVAAVARRDPSVNSGPIESPVAGDDRLIELDALVDAEALKGVSDVGHYCFPSGQGAAVAVDNDDIFCHQAAESVDVPAFHCVRPADRHLPNRFNVCQRTGTTFHDCLDPPLTRSRPTSISRTILRGSQHNAKPLLEEC